MSSSDGDGALSNVGFTPSQVEGKVDDLLLCCICYNVVETPAETPCGHLFCGMHIRIWLDRGNATCPVCRHACTHETLKEGQNIHVSYRRLLSDLKIACDNAGMGCKEVLSTKTFREHVNKCEFAPAYCRWEGCPNHWGGDASKREMLTRRGLATHEKSCKFRMVLCDMQGCNAIVSHQDLPTHMERCGRDVVMCSVMGCNTKMPRNELRAHLEDLDVMPRHMRLLTAQVTYLSMELEKPNCILNNEVVIKIPDITKKIDSQAFRFESKLYTLPVIGTAGYNFRIQLRKRDWPEDRKRLNDKLGIYLHMEPGDVDSLLAWPFPYDFTFTIFDHAVPRPEHITFTVTDGSTRGADWLGPGSGKGWGPQGIASFSQLRAGTFIKNDTMFVKVKFHCK